jgi:agmatine deiminase
LDESLFLVISDGQTNYLYLADTLPIQYAAFYKRFQSVLEEIGISYSLMSPTKDVWAVDYMPIQVTESKFIKFVYYPDYLRDTIKWRKTISEVDKICGILNLSYENSDILIDGGNVVRTIDKVIMCDKVFEENPLYSEKQLTTKLKHLFEVDRLIVIPTDPFDTIGHADGIARFLDQNTVLINDYSKEDREFQLQLKLALHNAGLDFIELPYNPYYNENDLQANGVYLNYLQMEQAIVIPTFNMADDERAVRQFETLFKTITTVNSDDIAKDGGVLNCISWNIHKSTLKAI